MTCPLGIILCTIPASPIHCCRPLSCRLTKFVARLWWALNVASHLRVSQLLILFQLKGCHRVTCRWAFSGIKMFGINRSWCDNQDIGQLARAREVGEGDEGGEEEGEAKPKSAPKSRSFAPPLSPSFVTRKIGIKPRARLDFSNGKIDEDLTRSTERHRIIWIMPKKQQRERRGVWQRKEANLPDRCGQGDMLGTCGGLGGTAGFDVRGRGVFLLQCLDIRQYKFIRSRLTDGSAVGKPFILKLNRFQIKMI